MWSKESTVGSIGLAQAKTIWRNLRNLWPSKRKQIGMAATPPRPDDARHLAIPNDPKEIENRANWWEFEDPFDDLVPSLLTAEQTENYMRVVGLFHPFDPNRLKSTTYEVGISGKAYSWGEGKKLRISDVAEQAELGITLEKNSITFVETDVEFLLPHYIAMRFNLHIKLVHRGLLLGTGPIVDPGFRGKLLIPLHNLTNSSYTIDPGEKIIWVEFSKTLWGHHSERDGYEIEVDPEKWRFKESKRRRTPWEYLDNANAGNPIKSSIAGFISSTSKSVKKTERKVNGIALFGFFSLLLGIAGAIWASWSVYNNAIGVVRADENRRAQLELRVRHLEECAAIAKRPAFDSQGKSCEITR